MAHGAVTRASLKIISAPRSQLSTHGTGDPRSPVEQFRYLMSGTEDARRMDRFRHTETVESFEDLCCTICWDEDEDPAEKLAGGVYATCGGEWRREDDNQWRFWEDAVVVDELRHSNGQEP